MVWVWYDPAKNEVWVRKCMDADERHEWWEVYKWSGRMFWLRWNRIEVPHPDDDHDPFADDATTCDD